MRQTLLIVFGLVVAFSVQAASFDCNKAATKVEKLICADSELSKLDEELAVAYKTVLQDGKQAETIRQAQKQWMKMRNGCPDTACVKLAYEERLRGLTTHITDDTPTDSSEPDVFTSGSIDMGNAGRHFKLIKGKGVEVCEIYKKNLESLGNPNLACERKVSPKYEYIIRLPDWRKIDLWQNRNLWAQVEKMANGEVCDPIRLKSRNTAMDDQREIDKLAKSYQEHAEQYHEEVYKMSMAEIDMGNDGKNEQVLREHSGICGQHRHYKSIALFVLDEKGDSIDLQKSRPLFQDPCFDQKTIKPNEQTYGFGNGEMYDVFFYKDKTYFDRWASSGIWIYRISNGKTETICHLN